MNDILTFNVKHELETMIDDNALVEEVMLPISQKMSKSFTRYYLEQVLLESPMCIDSVYPTRLGEWAYNAAEAYSFNNGTKGKLIGEFNHLGKILIYEIIDKKTIEYTLLNENKTVVLGRAKLIKERMLNKEYFFTNGLWNHMSEGTGVIYKFFIQWLLPKYKTLISDNITSKLGKNFWIKIIEYGLSNDKECGIFIDPKSPIEKVAGFIRLNKKEEFLDSFKHNMQEKRIFIKEYKK